MSAAPVPGVQARRRPPPAAGATARTVAPWLLIAAAAVAVIAPTVVPAPLQAQAAGEGESESDDRATVPLPDAPTADVAVAVAGVLDVGATVCALQGPAWASVATDGSIAVDRARFAPGWLQLRVARRDGPRRGCTFAEERRLFVGRFSPQPAPSPSATVLPETGIVELGAATLEGFDAVLLHLGRVRSVARCLGRRTCALELPPALMASWLRSGDDAQLLLWPSAVPLTVGAPLPALHDGTAFLASDAFVIRTVAYELLRPMLGVATLDGHSDRTVLPLALPEAVAAVQCKHARCALSQQGLEIYALDSSSLKVQVRLELRPEVTRIIAGRPMTRETFALDVVRCVVRLPEDTPLLAGIESHAYAVALSRDCLPEDANDLEVRTFPPTTAWVRGEAKSRDRAFRVFEIVFDKVPERVAQLELTLRRADPIGTTLAQARIAVAQDFRPVGVRLDIGELGSVDFVPRNRVARLQAAFTDPRWARDVFVIDRPGFYDISDDRKTITGATAATGSVPLRLAYAPAALTKLLRRADPVAVFDTVARYTVRTVNVPMPLARPASPTAKPIVRVACRRGGVDVAIPPGKTSSIAFEERFGCHLIIDRAAIPAEAGEQRLRVRAPGLNEVITVSGRRDEIELAISVNDREEFDVIQVSVAHEYTGAHYDFSPRQSLGAEASWHIVLGDGSFRASVGTAMPTGLFRFGTDASRSAVAFSAGGLARIHWLYREGREFPIGLDLGVLGTGLSSDPQLSVVFGLGFSVPVLNANTNLQASFNLHAWIEYSPTRNDHRTAFLFGPSFAVGKFSANL